MIYTIYICISLPFTNLNALNSKIKIYKATWHSYYIYISLSWLLMLENSIYKSRYGHEAC